MPSNTGKAITKPGFKRRWGDFQNQFVRINSDTATCFIQAMDGNEIEINKSEIDSLVTTLREAKRNM